MSVTRRAFLQYCAVCGAVLTFPGCRGCQPHNEPPPSSSPPITPPRGVDPPNLAQGELPPLPDDPQIQSRIEKIRISWMCQPRPLRQDGMWPYLLIRAFPGDHGKRPTNQVGGSPDILLAEGFPASLGTSSPLFCHLDSPWTIYVRVWNLGRLPAFAATLRVYSASKENLTQRTYDNFQLIGGMYLNLGDKTQRSCQQMVQFPVPWVPRKNATNALSFALFAVASATTDPTGNMPAALADPGNDRHVGSLFLGQTWSAGGEGDLPTPDPADHIHYKIEHRAVGADSIFIRLVSGPPMFIYWDYPTGGVLSSNIENSSEVSILAVDIRPGRSWTFVTNQPRIVLELRDLDCLQGGDRVTFSYSPG